MKDVDLSLDAEDLPTDMESRLIESSTEPLYRRTTEMHEKQKNHLRDSTWPSKTNLVLENLKLDRLTVYFYKSRCINACCSMIIDALWSFESGFAHGMPRELLFFGLDDLFEDECVDHRGWHDGHNEVITDAFTQWTEERLRPTQVVKPTLAQFVRTSLNDNGMNEWG